MKYIYFIALLLGGSFCFAEDEDPLTQLELMNTLTRQEIQLEQMKLEAEIHDRLNEIDMQNAAILTRLQVRDSDMGNYIDALSWVSGVVIGFVGILFGIGAFILYRENQDVATRTREQLDAWNEQTANLQSTFDDWFVNAKKEYTGELDLLSRIMRLRIILDQESPTAEEIYPEISPDRKSVV